MNSALIRKPRRQLVVYSYHFFWSDTFSESENSSHLEVFSLEAYLFVELILLISQVCCLFQTSVPLPLAILPFILCLSKLFPIYCPSFGLLECVGLTKLSPIIFPKIILNLDFIGCPWSIVDRKD